jgi:glycerophosphoryl diester phosphodiesterase
MMPHLIVTACRLRGLAVLMFLFAHTPMSAQPFDLQGHRGCRGLMPENSIPGFIRAMDLGVSTLEMDVVISADSIAVVSHEAWLSPQICLDEMGLPLPSQSSRINLYRMPYADIRLFDCGSKGNPAFPAQEKISTHKPSLLEAVEAIEAHAAKTGRTGIRYNIELKSSPATDHLYHPAPELFAAIVYRTLSEEIGFARVTLQSFDPRILQEFRRIDPALRLSLLIEKSRDPEMAIAALGFKPEVYSPHYSLLKATDVQQLQAQGIAVIPWTVNNPRDMKKMLALGVDGLITDYPDRFLQLPESGRIMVPEK